MEQPTNVELPVPYLSASRIDVYAKCPLQYYFNYSSTGLKMLMPKEFVLGSLCHDALEAYKKQESLEWETLKEIIMDTAEKTKFTNPPMIKECIAILKEWHGRIGKHWEDVISVEEKFDITLDNGVRIVGRIDKIIRVDEVTIKVIDYKSNWFPFTREQVDNSIQLGVYAIAARKMYPNAMRIELAYDFLRHGIAEPTNGGFTDEDLDFLEDYLYRVQGMILADNEPKATPAPASCKWCSWTKHCTAFQELLEAKEIPWLFDEMTFEERLYVLREIEGKMSMLESVKGQIRAEVQMFMQANADKRVDFGPCKILSYTSQRVAYNQNVVKEILEPKGMYDDVVKLEKKKVNTAIAELSDAEKARIHETSTTSFSNPTMRINWKDKIIMPEE